MGRPPSGRVKSVPFRHARRRAWRRSSRRPRVRHSRRSASLAGPSPLPPVAPPVAIIAMAIRVVATLVPVRPVGGLKLARGTMQAPVPIVVAIGLLVADLHPHSPARVEAYVARQRSCPPPFAVGAIVVLPGKDVEVDARARVIEVVVVVMSGLYGRWPMFVDHTVASGRRTEQEQRQHPCETSYGASSGHRSSFLLVARSRDPRRPSPRRHLHDREHTRFRRRNH